MRLARVARLVLVTKHVRRLFEQLGRAALVFLAVVLSCSYIAYQAERLVNPEFKSFADALWWAVVTICTVGYGDITPITTAGRWAGVILMVTGIGIIGALAGSLASFLRLAPAASTSPAARHHPRRDPDRGDRRPPGRPRVAEDPPRSPCLEGPGRATTGPGPATT